MKQVGVDYFKEFCFPQRLQTNGEILSFVVKQADMKLNGYKNNIWLHQNGISRPLTFAGDIQDYWWASRETIVFSAERKAKGEKQTGKKTPQTMLYKISVSYPGEAEEFLQLPYDIQEIEFIRPDYFVFSAVYNPETEECVGLNEQEAEEKWMQQQSCTIFTELPFWANGQGVVSGQRTRLYKYKEGEITLLTDADTSVEHVRLSTQKDAVYCLAQTYRTKAEFENRLLEISLSTLEVRDFTVEKKFMHLSFALLTNDDIVVFGSNSQEYGINQNGDFYLVDGVTGQSRVLYEGQEYSGWDSLNSDLKMAAECRWFAHDDLVYWTSTVGSDAQLLTIDCNTGAVHQVTNESGAVMEIVLLENTVYFSGMRGLQGAELYRFENSMESQLTRLNEKCTKDYSLATMEEVFFENSEGFLLRGWMLPPLHFDRQGEAGVPAIVNIHGGPKMAYGSLLFHEMQYWSAQGYAVLFCNPTGSDGNGAEFSDIRGRYGLIDYEDIMMFVEEVLERYDWIDGDRMGVTGGSYGGYMTNWIIGHTNRFRAAVSQRGIASWISMATTTDIGYYFASDQAGADIWSDIDAVWEQSPLKYADKVATPTLFLHSDQDYRCWMSEALQMYTALKIHNVEARLCLFHNENHDLSRTGKPQSRVRRLQEITRWFDKHLKEECLEVSEESTENYGEKNIFEE